MTPPGKFQFSGKDHKTKNHSSMKNNIAILNLPLLSKVNKPRTRVELI